LSRVGGMSTTGRSIRFALRMRVSMSAKGSVIMVYSLRVWYLPARLHKSGDNPFVRHVPQANAANAELAEHCAGTATQPTTKPETDPLAGFQFDFVRFPAPSVKLRDFHAESAHLA